MKPIRMSVYCCAVSMMFGSYAQATDWMTSYQEALDQARGEKKPLLVVFEQPSQRLIQAGEADDTDGKAEDKTSDPLLDAYKLCRIDVGTQQGKSLAKVFNAKQFPYTVITDRQGKNIIYRKSGQPTGLDWATMLVTYRSGKKPASVLGTLQLAPSVCFT